MVDNLSQYIAEASVHGSHRIAVLLKGDAIGMKRLCKALKMRIQDYVGAGIHKAVWFAVAGGVVLIVSGSRVCTEVTEKFLSGYTDAHDDYQVLYTGTGTKVFNHIVGVAIEHREKSARSFGSTR
jgi:hypothetical protein